MSRLLFTSAFKNVKPLLGNGFVSWFVHTACNSAPDRPGYKAYNSVDGHQDSGGT
jgi:hypothetical protein